MKKNFFLAGVAGLAVVVMFTACSSEPREATGDSAELQLRQVAGPQGLEGPRGTSGKTGETGSPGNIGPVGPAGETGANGATGAIGPVGPAGETGANGATGAIGPVGPAGETGATGLTGATGPAGSSTNGGDGFFAFTNNGIFEGSNYLYAGGNYTEIESLSLTEGKYLLRAVINAEAYFDTGPVGYVITSCLFFDLAGSPLVTNSVQQITHYEPYEMMGRTMWPVTVVLEHTYEVAAGTTQIVKFMCGGFSSVDQATYPTTFGSAYVRMSALPVAGTLY